MGLQVEVQGEALVAEVANVVLFASVHQHVPLQLCVVQESLLAPWVGTLEKFVTVNRVVLFQRRAIVEDFPAGRQLASENFVLALSCACLVRPPSDHTPLPFFQKRLRVILPVSLLAIAR